jgi:hypothetical protein
VELRPPLDPEVSAYRLLRGALAELQEAERALLTVQENAPDPTRAILVAAIQVALGQLETLIAPLPQS